MYGGRLAVAVARLQRQQPQERPQGDQLLGYPGPSPAEDRNRKRREDDHDAAWVCTNYRRSRQLEESSRCSGWTEECPAERGMDSNAFWHHCRRQDAKCGPKTARSSAFSPDLSRRIKVVKCGIRKQYVIKDPGSDEAIVAVRSELNTAHRKLFDAIKEAMVPCDALATLHVGNLACAPLLEINKRLKTDVTVLRRRTHVFSTRALRSH